MFTGEQRGRFILQVVLHGIAQTLVETAWMMLVDLYVHPTADKSVQLRDLIPRVSSLVVA